MGAAAGMREGREKGLREALWPGCPSAVSQRCLWKSPDRVSGWAWALGPGFGGSHAAVGHLVTTKFTGLWAK